MITYSSRYVGYGSVVFYWIGKKILMVTAGDWYRRTGMALNWFWNHVEGIFKALLFYMLYLFPVF